MAVLTPTDITFYNVYGERVDKAQTHIDWDADAAQKGGYEHFMLKEIYEQPKVCKDTVSPRIIDGKVDLTDAGIDSGYFGNINKATILGCGTASYAGMVGKYWLEKYAKLPAEIAISSEFRYSDPIIDDKTLIIVVSQSGETADSIAALREAKRSGAKTLAIVNVRGSTIAREADSVLYMNAGPEIAVASTKAYSAQLAALALTTLCAAEQRGTLDKQSLEDIIAALTALPEKIEQILKNTEYIQYLGTQYFNHTSMFYIGRNLDYAAALEGSHKLKEISYIHAETYAGGELKHGAISLIEQGTPVIALAVHASLANKTESNIAEVKTRGAKVLCVTTTADKSRFEEIAEHVIVVPDTHEMLTPLLTAIPLQLFAYYVALARNCDIDQPRNLAKSVTVE
jgi:glucosamine--fructose-6-phosphate aminotransferase (isomerizing)